MKNTTKLLVSIAVLLLSSAIARADIDKKLYERAARYVWDTTAPTFTTTADLSDPIFQGQSAVYIARLFSLDATYDQSPDASKLTVLGASNSNAIKAVKVRRNMVKLNDASALEMFTDFTIAAPARQSINGYNIIKTDPAFGARIYKPDGSVRTVDMSEALTVTKGKKNADDEYKIAIPGLEAGDILDYFYYTEIFLDELSLPVEGVNMIVNYPTRNLTINIKSSPELAVEYGAFNGAPALPNYTMIDGMCTTSISIDDIEAFPDKTSMASPTRQLPYYRFYCLNNKARLEFVPVTARAGGIRRANNAFFNSDVASYINKTKNPKSLISASEKIYNAWVDAHPDANRRQRIDALWLAMNYTAMVADENYGINDMVVAFFRLLEKTGCDVDYHIGYTSSRRKPALKEQVRFNEADFFVTVGDTTYYATTDMLNLPGEIPPGFDGEESVIFRADPANTNLNTTTEAGHNPQSYARLNTSEAVIDVAFAPDSDEQLKAKGQYTFTGAYKEIVDNLISPRLQVKALADYLGQNTDKLFKKYDMDAERADIDERFKNLAKSVWADDQVKLIGHSVLSAGTSPDQADMKISFEGTVDDAVSAAGNDLMVNLGRFIGNHSKFEGKEREREISIVREYPCKNSFVIRFTIPGGYTLVPESLEGFAANIKTPEVVLTSRATCNDGVVTIEVTERYNRSIMPREVWPRIVEIGDTLARIGSSSIVLRPR